MKEEIKVHETMKPKVFVPIQVPPVTKESIKAYLTKGNFKMSD
jgi:hypothetical protein